MNILSELLLELLTFMLLALGFTVATMTAFSLAALTIKYVAWFNTFIGLY